MIWLQLSANTGPAECCLAVTKALARVAAEATAAGVSMNIVEILDGPLGGTARVAKIQLCKFRRRPVCRC